jgi:hypothetical protein
LNVFSLTITFPKSAELSPLSVFSLIVTFPKSVDLSPLNVFLAYHHISLSISSLHTYCHTELKLFKRKRCRDFLYIIARRLH